MKKIHLTQGLVSLVDDEDYDFLNQWNWCVLTLKHNKYAKRTNKGIMMHREIMKLHNPGVEVPHVDHINHDGLDNRKINLRIATPHQNNGNRLKYDGFSSSYKGVHLESQTGSWRASIGIVLNGKKKNLKSPRFDDEQMAAHWYNEQAIKIFGNFALLNSLE